MSKGGRPRKEDTAEFDNEAEQVAKAYFGTGKSTLDIARQFGLSRRSIYRRIDRALRNRRAAEIGAA